MPGEVLKSDLQRRVEAMPSDTIKPPEVAVVGHDARAVLDGQRGQVGVVEKVCTGPRGVWIHQDRTRGGQPVPT
jgi:hypothetical protein